MQTPLNQKKYHSFSGFTLVELIVVITILVILGTIGFIQISGYSSSARDSVRTSDLSNLTKGLEVFMLKTGYYPTPVNPVVYTGGVSGGSIVSQGGVNGTLVGFSQSNPSDSVTKTPYVYSILGNGSNYQIGTELESPLSGVFTSPSIIVNQASADGPKTALLKGNYSSDPSLPSLVFVPGSVPATVGSGGIFSPDVCFVTNGSSTNLISAGTGTCIKKKSMNLKDLDSGLVGYWDMETLTGTLLKDLSGNGNDGVFSGATLPTSTGGIMGRGYYFSGAQFIIENKIFQNFSFQKGITVLGIANSYTGSQICDLFFSNGNINLLLNETISPVQFRFGDTLGNGINNTLPFGFGTKTFYGGVLNSSLNEAINKKIYSNGLAIQDTVYNGVWSGFTSTYSGSVSYIGSRPGSNCIGDFDEIKIYNRALSDPEIKQQARAVGF